MAEQKEIVFEYRVPGGKSKMEPVNLEAHLRMKALGVMFCYGIQDGISPEDLKSMGLKVSDIEDMARGSLVIPKGVSKKEMKKRISDLSDLLVQRDTGLAGVMAVLGLGKDGK